MIIAERQQLIDDSEAYLQHLNAELARWDEEDRLAEIKLDRRMAELDAKLAESN